MSDSTTLIDQLANSQANIPIRQNEINDGAMPAIAFSRRASTSTGLTWGFYGGRVGGTAVANGTLSLTGSTTNYVVQHKGTGALSTSTSTTNWDDHGLYARVYKIVTGSGSVSSYEDHRFGEFGTHAAAPVNNIVTVTDATYTQLVTDRDIIANRAGTITVTLLAAASYKGREIWIKTIQAQTVVSASSNVVPNAGGAAGTAILAATAGKWARLVSNGTAWEIMASN